MRSLKLKEVKYCILDGYLFWKDPLEVLLNCILGEETEAFILELHKGICGGHHACRATTYKVLRAGYY